MDKKDLFDAFGEIDPDIVARSEKRGPLAKKAGQGVSDKKNGTRNIITLIIIPVAVIAAVTAVTVFSHRQRPSGDPVVNSGTSQPRDPDEDNTQYPGATPDPTPELPSSPSPGAKLSDTFYSSLMSNGFGKVDYPLGLLNLAELTLENGRTIGESVELVDFNENYQDGFDLGLRYEGDGFDIYAACSERVAECYVPEMPEKIKTSSLKLLTNKPLGGLDLPFGICFNDSVDSALLKMGIVFDDFILPADLFDSGNLTTGDRVLEGFWTDEQNEYRQLALTYVYEPGSSDGRTLTYKLWFRSERRKDDDGNCVRYLCLSFDGTSTEQSKLTSVEMSVTETRCGPKDADPTAPAMTEPPLAPTEPPRTDPPATPTKPPVTLSTEQEMIDEAYEALSQTYSEFAGIPSARFSAVCRKTQDSEMQVKAFRVTFYIKIGDLPVDSWYYRYTHDYGNNKTVAVYSDALGRIPAGLIGFDVTEEQMAEYAGQLANQIESQIIPGKLTLPNDFSRDLSWARWQIKDDGWLYLSEEVLAPTVDPKSREFGCEGHAHLFAEIPVIELSRF